MSEHTLSSVTFPQAASAVELQPERLPAGIAVLTIVAASSLLWIVIFAAFRFMLGS
jgi:hypothetical protein